jgi:DNA-binding SARP family transcriptional activator
MRGDQPDLTTEAAKHHESYQLSLLGSFLLRDGEGSITLPTGPQRLLAFLAIHGPAPRSVVIGTLWPDVGESQARGSLRTTVWRLHRGAPGLLRSADDTLFLCPDVPVDIRAVAESAQAVLHDTDHAPAGWDALRAAGDLLPGWYDDWVMFERERLRQLRLHALEALAERFIIRGRHVDALEAAMESARIEPLRESANRMIMAIHLAEGNVAEARRHYELFRDFIYAELGIEPSPGLAAMLPGRMLRPFRYEFAAGELEPERITMR